MTGNHDDDALEALGRVPVVPPDDGFADRLEQRLRAEHGRRPPRAEGEAPPVRRVAARALAAAAAAVLVVGLAVSLASDRDDKRIEVRLASAEATTLVLPDGTVVEARAGMVLVDGTLVITSASGSARVDGVALPPDRVAVVEDGRLRLLDVDPAPPSSAPTTRPPDGGTGTSAPPGTDRPPVTAEPTTTRPPASSSTTSTTATAARLPVAAIDLAAERRDRRRVDLRWSGYPRDDFARYVMVRTVSDADARPPDPVASSTAVFASPDPAVRTFADELPAGTVRAAYRVIVLDRDHRVVGASAVARV